jgi:hypothetical protein
MSFKSTASVVTMGALLGLPMGAQAYSIPEFTQIYTPTNIQTSFPGYSSTFYTAASNAVASNFTSNSSCITAFNDYFGRNIHHPPTLTACETAIAAQINAAAGTTLTAGDVDTGLSDMYFAYSTTRLVSPIISLQVQQATTIRQAETISNILGSIANPHRKPSAQRVSLNGEGMTGLSAGGIGSKPSFWISGYGNTMKNDYAGARYDGDVYSFIGGADYTINPNLVVGLSLALENTKLATQYNRGSYQAESWMLAPYVGYIIDKTWSIDASAGYAWGDSEIKWNSGIANTAKQDLTRNFAAVNLNAQHWMGDTELSGKATLIRAEEKLDASRALLNSAIKNSVTQMKLTGRVGYWMNDVMPYVSLSYVSPLLSG